MFREIFLNILEQTWPMILIVSVIVVSMRITWLYKNKSSFTFYKEILSFAFIVYVMCLFYVVTFQDVSWSDSNFIPFKEMFRYEFGSSMFFRNVVGNMIMFMPYGFFVSYFLKLSHKYSILILSLLTSFTIEFTQLQIGRVFDIDDIILNVIGAMIGYFCYFLLMKCKDKLPKILKKTMFYNILVVVILIVIVLYLSNYIRLGV